MDFQDAETGEIITVDTFSTAFKKELKKYGEKRKRELVKKFRKSDVGSVFVSDPKNYIDPLVAYFKTRHK